ncbi:hypothetical protein EYF80_016763 [Liparis tanakae]|uniref:Uncharacterized protein n=1 Tax=Liparis tanakae TaxID=230148 RepID=A0A4Z2I719_9TELE|nr:hypothetical protein EYF80_016763 [Liparis tanakae]
MKLESRLRDEVREGRPGLLTMVKPVRISICCQRWSRSRRAAVTSPRACLQTNEYCTSTSWVSCSHFWRDSGGDQLHRDSNSFSAFFNAMRTCNTCQAYVYIRRHRQRKDDKRRFPLTYDTRLTGRGHNVSADVAGEGKQRKVTDTVTSLPDATPQIQKAEEPAVMLHAASHQGGRGRVLRHRKTQRPPTVSKQGRHDRARPLDTTTGSTWSRVGDSLAVFGNTCHFRDNNTAIRDRNSTRRVSLPRSASDWRDVGRAPTSAS